MSAKLDQLNKKLDEGPSIPSGIVTPEQIHELVSPRGEQQQILVSAPSLQLLCCRVSHCFPAPTQHQGTRVHMNSGNSK